ncbi:hypothetical protein COBT_001323 [Conglomerata obtusa]
MQVTKTKFKELFLFYSKTYNESSLLWVYKNIKNYILENGLDDFVNEVVPFLEKVNLKDYNVGCNMMIEVENLVLDMQKKNKDDEIEYIIEKSGTYGGKAIDDIENHLVSLMPEMTEDNGVINYLSTNLHEDKDSKYYNEINENLEAGQSKFTIFKNVINLGLENFSFDQKNNLNEAKLENLTIQDNQTYLKVEPIQNNKTNIINNEIDNNKIQNKQQNYSNIDKTQEALMKDNTLENQNILENLGTLDKIKKLNITNNHDEKNHIELNNKNEENNNKTEKKLDDIQIKLVGLLKEFNENDKKNVTNKSQNVLCEKNLPENININLYTTKYHENNSDIVTLDRKERPLIYDEIKNNHDDYVNLATGLAKITKPLLKFKAKEGINLIVHLSLETSPSVLYELLRIYEDKNDWLIELYIMICFVQIKKSICCTNEFNKCKELIKYFINRNDPVELQFTIFKIFNFLDIKFDQEMFEIIENLILNGNDRIKLIYSQNLHRFKKNIETEKLIEFFFILHDYNLELKYNLYRNSKFFEIETVINDKMYNAYIIWNKECLEKYHARVINSVEDLLYTAKIYIYFLRKYQTLEMKLFLIILLGIRELYIQERLKYLIGPFVGEIHEKLEIKKNNSQYMKYECYCTEKNNLNNYVEINSNEIKENKTINFNNLHDDKAEMVNILMKDKQNINSTINNGCKLIEPEQLIDKTNYINMSDNEMFDIQIKTLTNQKNFSNKTHNKNNECLEANKIEPDKKCLVCNNIKNNILNEVTEKLSNFKLSANNDSLEYLQYIDENMNIDDFNFLLEKFFMSLLDGNAVHKEIFIKEIVFLQYLDNIDDKLETVRLKLINWRHKKEFIESLLKYRHIFGDKVIIIQKYTKDPVFYIRNMAQDISNTFTDHAK